MAFILLLLETTILLTTARLAGASLLGDGLAPLRGGQQLLLSLVVALGIVFCMSALGLYQPRALEGVRATLVRVPPLFGLALVVLSAGIAARPELRVGSGAGLAFALGAVGVLCARVVVVQSARSRLLKGRVLLVGAGALARECIELAEHRLGFHELKVLGCVDVHGEVCCVPDAQLIDCGGGLLAVARQLEVSEIVVAVSNRRNRAFPVRELLACALGGVPVIDAAMFFEREACQIRIESLHPSYLIFGGGFDQSFLRAASKRWFDLLASTILTMLALPLMLATALCIVCEDGGPVLYRQERVGKDGRRFNVLKFRSMGIDAEKGGTPTWAAADDPRVTRVGAIIRKLRIDELPQMLNVLKGEMSFVGPRPERAYFVEQLAGRIPYYNVRHSIKPGVTGLAQVRYHYGATVNDAIEKLQYDLYYVKNNSLFLDLLILVDTVQVVLTGKGSR